MIARPRDALPREDRRHPEEGEDEGLLPANEVAEEVE